MSNIIPLTGCSISEFTPTAFREGEDPYPVFRLRVPTFRIRDKMAAILFQRGLFPATVTQSRGILINALYELYDEATAEDHATFLESYWTRAEVHEELVNAWQIREAQRLFDLGQGVDKAKLERLEVPPAPYTMREQARQASILTYAMENNEQYREYQSRFMVQQEEEEEMMVRLFVDGWSGIASVPAERDAMDRLTVDCLENVRQWLQDNGANDAWEQVTNRVRQLFGAPAVLEKNSVSPLDTNSNPTGLRVSSGDLETSDGSSTTSPITPTRRSKSPATSAGSRNSPSSRKGRTAKTGPTAALSSTSPSG